MIVVDSSVWIARFRNDDTSAAGKLHKIELSDPDIILVGDLVLLEVLRGARDDRHASRIEKRLREFTIESMVDARLAVVAARNYRFLRERGVTIRKTIDLAIATFCMERGHWPLHDDRDFAAVAKHLPLDFL